MRLFTSYHDEKDKIDSTLSVDLNVKSYTSKAKFVFTQAGQDYYNIKLTFQAKPYDGEVNVERPADAINIQDVLAAFDFSEGSGGPVTPPQGTAFSRARDTERETDIRVLHSQLEAFYAQKGFYPGFNDFNSPSWRASNMPGLESEALRDPEGTEAKVLTTASASSYGYRTAGCNSSGTECQGYTLSAQISNGDIYTKQNLN